MKPIFNLGIKSAGFLKRSFGLTLTLLSCILFISQQNILTQPTSKLSELSQLNAIAQYSFGTLVICGNDGYILRTINNGGNWYQFPSGTTENLNALDGTYIVGAGGIILYSEGAGNNWSQIQSGTTNELKALSWYPHVAVGAEGTIVAKLNDTTNIFVAKQSGVTVTLNGVSFADQQIGFAVGDNGTMIKTTDGGESWSAITSGITNNLNAIIFVPFTAMGWIVGNGGLILFSNDGGVTWNPQSSGTTENLFSISATDFNSLDVLAAGANGTVIKSNDGGTNWVVQNSSLTANLRSISNYSSDYIAGDNITIAKSTDGGVTWGLINNNITDVEDKSEINLTEYQLNQNYPNPFNPSTKISWHSPVGGSQTLKIYDLLGNDIATLVDEYLPAGSYEIEWNAVNAPSGIYFYKLQAGSYIETKKMLMIK